ncbi:MAG: aromatic aminobenezylarsenical efflux permease ArsG family transporter [archaeon]
MSLMSFMGSMGTSSIPLLAAFFIGLMTAISPCPLATNITAIAYISKRLDNSKHTVLVGLFYTLGRMLTYVTIAALIVWFGLNMQFIALGLQKYGEKLLGPLLIIIGIFMLDVIRVNALKSNPKLEAIKEKLSRKGLLGSFLLGVLFALAFCPFSAVLFFGMLIPLAIKMGDGLLIPAVFAFATGLPVIILSFILVHSLSKLSKVMNKIQQIENTVQKVVGAVFIIVGAYYLWIGYF